MLSDTSYRTHAEQILKSGWVRPNNAFSTTPKFGSLRHHPTTVAPKHLSEPEQKLYDLVTKRFLAIFYPAANFS